MRSSINAEHKPIYGVCATLTWGAFYDIIIFMMLRNILAENIRSLMESSQSAGTEKSLRQQAKIGGGTLDGARQGTKAITIDSLEKIAHALHVQPWQLLIPGLDPANPPQLRKHYDDIDKVSHALSVAMEAIATYERDK